VLAKRWRKSVPTLSKKRISWWPWPHLRIDVQRALAQR
jgi:hypothetical protein